MSVATELERAIAAHNNVVKLEDARNTAANDVSRARAERSNVTIGLASEIAELPDEVLRGLITELKRSVKPDIWSTSMQEA